MINPDWHQLSNRPSYRHASGRAQVTLYEDYSKTWFAARLDNGLPAEFVLSPSGKRRLFRTLETAMRYAEIHFVKGTGP